MLIVEIMFMAFVVWMLIKIDDSACRILNIMRGYDE